MSGPADPAAAARSASRIATGDRAPEPIPDLPPRPWRRMIPGLAGLALAILLPFLDALLPSSLQFASLMPGIFALALVALGLNILVGHTGLLNLGVGAFMAIGVYVYSILTSDSYPFCLHPWLALVAAGTAGAGAGVVLGLPTMRLAGDYLAIVTLGFVEIVKDCLLNLEPITKGVQGINPVPSLAFPGLADGSWRSAYWIGLGFLTIATIACRNLRRSRTGRAWVAVRDDELAARCCGVSTQLAKLGAFATCAACAALGGGLYAASLQSSLDPGQYGFQLSVVALCAVIIGGLGSIPGVLIGSLIMFGLNGIVLKKLADALQGGGGNVLAAPGNWKYLLFGLALVLVMRYRPQGLWPAEQR